MNQYINTSEFMSHLKKQGLVIVSKNELEKMAKTDLFQKRRDLLSKRFLTLKEVLSLELLPVKTKTSLERWIKESVFLPSEVSRNNRNFVIVATSSLKRLGYV